MEKVDYRGLSCPHCGEKGTVHIDPSTGRFRCRKCYVSDINPYQEKQAQAKKKLKPMPKAKPDPRPALPENWLHSQIVEDYFTPYTGSDILDTQNVVGAVRGQTSKVFLPKEAVVKDEEFDPTTPHAQFYLKQHAKRFKNRRRYDRDLKRRGENE